MGSGFMSCNNIKDLESGKVWICGGAFKLSFADVEVDIEATGKKLTVRNCPIIICPDCQKSSCSQPARIEIEHFVREALSAGEQPKDPNFDRYLEMKQSPIHGFEFPHDIRDNYFSPLLYGQGGRLTPIFLHPDCLAKYRHARRIRELADSHLEITSDDGSKFRVGRNRDGKVIIWYSELAQLSKNEVQYLHTFRIESAHDVFSEYHDALFANLALPQEPRETTVYKLHQDLISQMSRVCGGDVMPLKDEVHARFQQFQSPRLDPLTVADALEELNVMLIESISRDPFIKSMKVGKKDVEGLGNLKTLEKWCEEVLGIQDARALLMPFAVLNGLRQLKSHLMSQRKQDEYLTESREMLGLAKDATLNEIYEVLIAQLAQSYYKLIDACDGHKGNAAT